MAVAACGGPGLELELVERREDGHGFRFAGTAGYLHVVRDLAKGEPNAAPWGSWSAAAIGEDVASTCFQFRRRRPRPVFVGGAVDNRACVLRRCAGCRCCQGGQRARAWPAWKARCGRSRASPAGRVTAPAIPALEDIFPV